MVNGQAPKKSWFRTLLRRTSKSIVILIAVVVMLISTTLVAIHIPSVQRRLVQNLSQQIESLLHFRVSIGYVYISWLDTIVMKDVVIYDRKDVPMISVHDLRVRFSLPAFLKRDIVVRAAYLDQPDVRMYYYKEIDNFNVTQFIDEINRVTNPENKKPEPNAAAFTIRNVELEHGNFIYSDPSQDTIRYGFDHLHEEYRNINASVEDFMVKGRFIGMNIKHISGKERYSNLDIRHLQGYLGMDSVYMRLDRLDARIGRDTRIKRSIAFTFQDWRQFKHFNDSIMIDAKLDTAYINFDDLRAFMPFLPNQKERFWLKTNLKGTVNDLKLRNLSAGFGKGSTLEGSVTMKGLPFWDTTKLVVNLRDSKIQAPDLSRYFDTTVQTYLNSFGKTEIQGYFKGIPTRFDLFASLGSEIGNVSTNLSMDIKPNSDQTSYHGKIITDQFHLGKLISQPELFQQVTVNTNLNGRGFRLEALNLYLKGNAATFGLRGYPVHDIVVDGHFGDKQFNGLLSVNDPNLTGKAEGRVDLKNQPEIVNLDLNLANANLAKFQLLPDITSLKGKFTADFKGLDADAMKGFIRATEVAATIKGKAISLSEVALRKFTRDEDQIIELESDWADFKLEGPFKLKRLWRDANELTHEFAMFFGESQQNQQRYYQQKVEKGETYNLTFKAEAKDPKMFFALYGPKVILSNNSVLTGSFTSGSNAVIILNAEADSIGYDKNLFQEVSLDVNSTKARSASEVLATAHLTSKQQKIGGLNPMHDLTIDADWVNDKINFDSRVVQEQPEGSIYKTANELKIGGLLKFFEDRYVMNFQKSSLRMMDDNWSLDANNQLTVYYKGDISVDRFGMTNNKEDVTAFGIIGADKSDSLTVKIKELDLDILSSIIGKKIGGRANADFVLRAALGTTDLHGYVDVDSLAIEKYILGHVKGGSAWDNQAKNLRVNLNLDRDGKQIVGLTGTYTPDIELPINMEADVTGLSLQVMEPFLGSIMTNWAGTGSGKLDLTGAFDKLVLNGALNITGGVFKYSYLNTNYRFNDRILFSKNLISMDNTYLIDAFNQRALMRKMRINHTYWQNYGIDCEAQLENFQVMNTTVENNSLYYGVVAATGPFIMRGQFDNLYVRGDLSSNRGTLVNIPVKTGESQAEQLSYIEFIDSQKPGKLIADTIKRKMDLSGITMDFNLNVTPDAEIDIVFNAKNGELIKAQGNGKLKLAIDTRGDFTMYGDYTISKGTYNFIFLNTVNKKFDLESGSSLTWTGKPTGALMRIKAKHTLNASLRPLVFTLDSTALQRPELQRKYPVSVNMDISGDMLKPSIVFGIEIQRNYPASIGPDVTSFESRIQTDEQELNRQVFSLFLIRGFMPLSNVANAGSENLFASGSSATISEMLSNQISSLLSTVDQNLSVDIDVNGWDQSALNALQLRLSYTFFEGRVRVARSGGVTNAQNQTTAASIAGDWLVEYMLSKDGIFRMRAFVRNNPTLIAQGFSTQQNTTTSGFTVLHTQSFDHISELFTRPKVVPLAPAMIDFKSDSADTDTLSPQDTTKPTSRRRSTKQPARSGSKPERSNQQGYLRPDVDRKLWPVRSLVWPNVVLTSSKK